MMSEKLRAIVEQEFREVGNRGEAAFDGGNCCAEINLHISVAVAGERVLKRFVDLLVAIL
jgi:hypothetical protein